MYEKLILKYKNEIDDFFKNVPTFDNQFRYENINKSCLEKMYKENNIESPKTVKELKEEIPELKEMCKKCGNYFMNPRNNSHIKYDLIMGQFFENIIIDFLKSELKINAEHGDKSNKQYPDCMILGKDRGIVAYFEVKYHGAPFISAINKINRYCYEGSATLDEKKIIKQLEIIESDIERPVFYLHWINYPCLKGIFFETSEQVKDYLVNNKTSFVRNEREGDLEKTPQTVYKEKIYSPLLFMGDFDEFIGLLKKMIKGE